MQPAKLGRLLGAFGIESYHGYLRPRWAYEPLVNREGNCNACISIAIRPIAAVAFGKGVHGDDVAAGRRAVVTRRSHGSTVAATAAGGRSPDKNQFCDQHTGV